MDATTNIGKIVHLWIFGERHPQAAMVVGSAQDDAFLMLRVICDDGQDLHGLVPHISRRHEDGNIQTSNMMVLPTREHVDVLCWWTHID